MTAPGDRALLAKNTVNDMQTSLKNMLEKLEALPPERLAEVADFVDFLYHRDQQKHLRQNFQQAMEKRFGQVWDNDDDAAYDQL